MPPLSLLHVSWPDAVAMLEGVAGEADLVAEVWNNRIEAFRAVDGLFLTVAPARRRARSAPADRGATGGAGHRCARP